MIALRRFLATALTGALTLEQGLARAEQQIVDREAPPIEAPKAMDPSSKAPMPTVWYGWQILAFDLPVTAVHALTFHGPPLLYPVSTGAFFFGSPVIHLVHRNYWRSGGSFLLHSGLLVLGGTLGCWAGLERSGALAGTCNEKPLRIGEIIGSVVAITVDAAFLAHDEVPRGENVAIAPTFSASVRGGATLGVVGRF